MSEINLIEEKCKKQINDIDYNLNNQIKIRNSYLEYMDKISSIIDKITFEDNFDLYFSKLDQIREKLDVSSQNIETLQEMQITCYNLKINQYKKNSVNQLHDFIKECKQKQEQIDESSKELNSFLEELSNINFDLESVRKNKKQEEIHEEINIEDKQDTQNEQEETKKIEEKENIEDIENKEDIEKNNLSAQSMEASQSLEKEKKEEEQTVEKIENKDQKNDEQKNEDIKQIQDNNILLISEKDGKVYLPYKVETLKQILENNKEYKTLSEVIEKQFVKELSYYKYPAIARFKEAYHLMKNKEKSSTLKALDLAFELSFNSLLNPAIITACQNLDQLDIYLDYLNNNEVDKFHIFEIKYNFAPALNNKLEVLHE